MDEFYTVNQAALTLKVHPLTIRRYIKVGKLKAFRVGGNIRILENDLKAFIQNFIPQPTHIKPTNQTQQFSFSDPLFSIKAKGLTITTSK